MSDIIKRVRELVEEKIAGTDLFIVNISMSPDNKLKILLDADTGVSIDNCAEISRYVGHVLEEENLIDHVYNLEVSSAGIDYPLQLERQFLKNIGRTVQVKMKNGDKKEGKLLSYNLETIEIESAVKEKDKKSTVVLQPISNQDIKEVKVIVSFK